MQWTVYGYSQESAIELGLDMVDLAIIRWIADFAGTKKMENFVDGNTTFYWIRYDYIIKELPILGLKKAALAKRLKNLASVGVLEHRTLYEMNGCRGTYSFYGFGDNYESLITKKEEVQQESKFIGVQTEVNTPMNQNSYPYEPKFIGGINQNSQGVLTKIKTKDSSTINSSTINSSTNIKTSKKSESDVVIDSYTDNPELKEALHDYIKMRKSIKKPMTAYALKLLTNKLNSMADSDEIKIAMLNNAIMHCWQSVYALKPEELSAIKQKKVSATGVVINEEYGDYIDEEGVARNAYGAEIF